ncbi:MAG: deoxyribose-phosphate aldolase [Actinomycetes bacterium]
MSPAARRHATTLADRIDHTLLDPTATQARVEQLCAEALQFNFAAVCVNSRWVLLVTDLLAESDVLVCTVVGFPLGAMSPEAKASEAAIAVAQGAQEIDMVIDIGALLSGDDDAVYADIAGVVSASEPMPVKVIIETCLLTDEQKVTACRLAMRAGAAYVKTSTGFSTGGATVEDVRLMRDTVGDELGVKASGGIRSRDTAEAMVAAGADRLGTSSGIKIVSEASSR